MKRHCVIGIDLGTSSCKTIAIDRDGAVFASASREYPLEQPRPGWFEQSPEDWWQAAADTLREIAPSLAGLDIRGISFSGQMHGLVALDDCNRVIRPAILWNDQRTQPQCDEIEDAAGGASGLLTFTNNRMLTGYTGGKILWLRENEPDCFAKLRVVLNPKDYIRYRLTRRLETDVSDASGTGLYDVKRRAWSQPLMERLGLSPALFPSALESTQQAGIVTAEAAAETGIPAGTAVYCGGGDAVISAIAAGLTTPDRISVTLGTSGVVATVLPGYMDNPEGKLQLFCNTLPGSYMAFGCTLAAAGSYQWFADAFIDGDDRYNEGTRLAQSVPAGAEGLIFLPYLTGERCPVFDSEASGAFVGIRAGMGRAHFARAVMEGVSFSLRQVYDLCVSSGGRAREIVISGGGARSEVWRQIIADVFDMRVVTISSSAYGGAFGAAMLAGLGSGFFASEQDAVSVLKKHEEIIPDPSNKAVYAARYADYCRLYDSLKWMWAPEG